MKTRLLFLAACVNCLVFGEYCANANLEVSAGISIRSTGDFYDPLSARGTWVSVGHYGRCWRPAGVVAGWRPYCHGYWEWTDCGWYWESDEPWAWACYHYGSWAFDPSYGWVWIPGTEWAPAWVCWRTGGDYIGWAPYGPEGVVVEPSQFVFVENRHFHDHFRPDTVIVNNTTIINKTTEVRNVQRETRDVNGRSQTVVVNNGPSVTAVSKATGHKYSAVTVQKVEESTIRSAPETLKYRAVNEPESKVSPNTFRTDENQSKTLRNETPGQESPYHAPPNYSLPEEKKGQPQERVIPEEKRVVPEEKVVPQEKNIPAEKFSPQVPPTRVVPEEPRERVVPQTPERVIPKVPSEKTMPEHPREMIPPNQVQPTPTVPPNEKGKEGKEKDQPNM